MIFLNTKYFVGIFLTNFFHLEDISNPLNDFNRYVREIMSVTFMSLNIKVRQNIGQFQYLRLILYQEGVR